MSRRSGKVLPYLLVVASILSGAAFGWYRAGMPRTFGRRSPAGTPETPRGPLAERVPERPPPSVEKPKPEGLSPLSRADALFQDLDFAAAGEAYAEARRGARGPRARKARRMEVLSNIFELATRRVPRTLAAEAPHEVTLANDQILVGRVTTDEAGNITLKTEQGISATFKPSEVASVRRVETASWTASRQKELRKRLDRIGRDLPPALDYFQAAYFCIRNGMADRAADLLLKSADSDGFEMVIETFGGDRSGQLLARWVESTREAPEPAPRAIAAGSGDDLDRAEGLYQEALKHYRRSWPGMEDAEKELRKARSLFEDAQTAFEKAKRARPGDSHLESRIQSVQTFIYDCIKRATL